MPEYSHSEEEGVDCEPVQLQPFIHQVGGHSCVLRFNETTLCKPQISREQIFYESIPTELKQFIPAYRGLIEVELQEGNDGQITLIGYPEQASNNSQAQRSGERLSRSSPKSYERETSPNYSSSETESQSPVLPSRSQHAGTSSNPYSVRILRSGSIEVSTQTDTVFYSKDPKSEQKSAGFNPWSLKCHKRQLAKMRMDNQDSNLKKFILLENVAAKFRFPCILDLKMGTRQHGDDAPEAKKTSQMRKCANTTSSAVGVRLIGMQVYQASSGQFVCQNKYYGRKLSVSGFKEVLELFMYDGDNMILDLFDPILKRLRKLYAIIEKQETFRFYSSSLLIMYSGRDSRGDTSGEGQNCASSDDDETNVNTQEKVNTAVNNASSGKDTASGSCAKDPHHKYTETDNDNILVDVRMIDFAHSTHSGFPNDEKHKGVDQGYLFGLQNLIAIFEEIRERYLGSLSTDHG